MFSIYDGRDGFCQWDLNQKLVVSAPCEVHFCNGTSDCSLVCETYEQDGKLLVNVPNILLQTAKNIRVYAYVKDNEEQYTKASKVFSVRARTKPDDYVYTETEIYSVEKAVAEAMQEAKDSGIFDGKDGEDGKDGAAGKDGVGIESVKFDNNIWRWVIKYTDGHIDTYSGHSPHDKYKFVIWRDDFTLGRDNVDWGVGNTALTDNAGEYYSTHPTTASRQQGVVEMNGEYVARLWSANGKYCRLVTKCHSWGAYTAQMDFMMNAPTGGASAPGLVLNLFEGYSFGSGNILAYLENAYGSRITDTTSGSDVHCWMNDSSGNRLKWAYDTWYTVKLSCKVGSITMSVWERGTDEKKAWTITYESDIITTKAIEAEKAFRIHSRKSSVSGTHNTVYLDNLMLWEDTFAQLEDALDSIITIQEALIGGNAT